MLHNTIVLNAVNIQLKQDIHEQTSSLLYLSLSTNISYIYNIRCIKISCYDNLSNTSTCYGQFHWLIFHMKTTYCYGPFHWLIFHMKTTYCFGPFHWLIVHMKITYGFGSFHWLIVHMKTTYCFGPFHWLIFCMKTTDILDNLIGSYCNADY